MKLPRFPTALFMAGLLVSAAVSLIASSGAAEAACAPTTVCADGLWKTGVNGAGNKLGGGVPDPHYSITSASGICAAQSGQLAWTVNEYNGSAGLDQQGNHNWAFTSPSASWIGANPYGRDYEPPGCASPEPSDWLHQSICGGPATYPPPGFPPIPCWTQLSGQLTFSAKQPFYVRASPAFDISSLKIEIKGAVDNMLAINVNGCFLLANDYAIDSNQGIYTSSPTNWAAPQFSGTAVTRFSINGCTVYTDGRPNTIALYLRSTYDQTGLIIPEINVTGSNIPCPAGTVGVYPVCNPVNPNHPQLVGNSGDIAAGAGLCGSAQKSGNITGNGTGYGQYVVAASTRVSKFGSSSAASGTSATLKGYAGACRTDLLSKLPAYTGTVYNYAGNSISVNQLNAFEGNNYIVKANGSLKLTAGAGDRLAKTMTLVVGGDLTIDSDVLLNAGTIYSPRNQPSLGVITNGDISIAATVSNVDAFLFSNGTINTCAGTFATCQNRLVVNGFLMAHGMQFNRMGIYAAPTGLTLPAETINLLPQLYLDPPPLFDQAQVTFELNPQGERPPLY